MRELVALNLLGAAVLCSGAMAAKLGRLLWRAGNIDGARAAATEAGSTSREELATRYLIRKRRIDGFG